MKMTNLCVAPPRKFKPAYDVRRGWFERPPSFAKRNRSRGLARVGLNFEKRILGELEKKFFKGVMLRGPWLGFDCSVTGMRYCQPDALVFDIWEGYILILECKLRHVSNAWYQMHELYKPVIEVMFPGWEVKGLEICKHFEPFAEYPEQVVSVRNPKKVKGFGGVMVCS